MELGWTSFLFLGIAVVLLWNISKYLKRELSIVPQEKFFQKFKVNFAIIIFSSVMTATILFIAGIISSAIASNASIAIESKIDEDIVSSFTWPTLLPITLMALGIYISVYPLIEMLYMGKKTQDGAMEIQKWIENNLVDRFKEPWSYFFAFFLFICIYIIPPSIISYYLIIIRGIPYNPAINISPLTMTTIIFLDWFMIFPLMYLTYYATIGSSQAFFAGLKANLRKNKTRLIYFIFAIFTFISAISNFIIYVPALFNPGSIEMAIPGETTGFGGFLQQIIEYFMSLDPNITEADWERWYNFVQIVPLDFLIFFIVTCVFSILGFYAKFLNKEPLNRPILVFFAAYIVSGIAFQVFGNIITKWPWAFPSQRLWLDLTDFSDPTIKLIMQLFIISVTADKIFTMVFLIYQLFFNKSLREIINEAVLTQAIADQDIEVLKKYIKDKNPRIRRIVAEAVEHIVENLFIEEDIDKLIPIFEELITDQDSSVVAAITPAIKIASFKISDERLNKLYPTIQLGFGTEKDSTILETQKLIIEMGKVKPDKIQELYEFLFKGYLPDKVKASLMEVLQILGNTFPELSYNIANLMLDRQNVKIQRGALGILKYLIHNFQPKFDEIYEKMKAFSEEKNNPFRGEAIELMAYIASQKEKYLDMFLKDYKEFTELESDAIRRVIGGLTQLIISYPDKIDIILPQITYHLYEKTKKEIKNDVIMSLGVIAINLDGNNFVQKIYPHFDRLSHDDNIIIKKSVLSTFNFIYKAREDLLELSISKELFRRYILDSNEEIKSFAIRILKSIDLIYAIDLLTHSLRLQLKKLDKKFILQHIYCILYENENVLREKLDEMEIKDIYLVISSQYTDDSDINLIITKLICLLGRYSRYVANDSYKILKNILDGTDYKNAAIVLEYLTDIIITNKFESNTYLIDLNFESFYEYLKKILKPIEKKLFKAPPKDERRIIAAKSLEKIYNVDSSKYNEIYKVYYSLKNDPSDNIKAIVILMCSKIACDYSEEFMKEYSTSEEIFRSISEKSKLEVEILPLIYENFAIDNKEIQDSIIQSINIITNTFANSTVIKQFLFKVLNKKASELTKITIIKCLAGLPEAEYDKKVILKLRQLSNDASPTIRIQAIIHLAKLFTKLKPLNYYIERKEKDNIRIFRLIKNSIIRRKFLKDSDSNVRKTFITEATKIAIKFPDLVEPMLYIKDYAMDKDKDVAILAIKSYFKFINVHPSKLESTANYMRFFANSPDINVKNILLDEIVSHYRKGLELKYYISTLLKLAIDKDKLVRKKSLSVFKEIYESSTEKLLYFIELLIKLTRDKDPRIRSDSFELIAQLTFEFPKNIKQQNLVFDTVSRLSRDYDISVKRVVSNYLENFVKLFPERLNQILQMGYNLFREKDRKIIQNCSAAFKYVLYLYPEKRKEIRPKLIQLYRRTSAPEIEQLIREYDKIKN
ncbi:MAG: HEAT repeat domain-containing protein [Promethearchaeota archaeon]